MIPHQKAILNTKNPKKITYREGFDVSRIRYDPNGKIDTLWRKVNKGTKLDRLTFNYLNAENRLHLWQIQLTQQGFMMETLREQIIGMTETGIWWRIKIKKLR